MTRTHLDRLLAYVQERHPRSSKGILEARSIDPAAFDRCGSIFLQWAIDALGEHAIERTVDAFVRFSNDVNFAQARYESAGRYENKTYDECRRTVYDRHETMTDYLWGVYLTNFLWSHHMDLLLFFEQRFIPRLKQDVRIIEIAPGHGGWGLWALRNRPDARLDAVDISASSIAVAGALSKAAGLDSRTSYERCNALDLLGRPSPFAGACICSFLVEHLEEPAKLLETMAHVLAPEGFAFFTGALTAAQVDHIHEFRRESELILLAEQHGFRVMETRSVSPARTLPKARFLPRSMALLMQKRAHDTW
jgi:2-polyprenyl-3-methyl-5-hydroxy-6-metoxy-1,4-benzoquinol methylase